MNGSLCKQFDFTQKKYLKNNEPVTLRLLQNIDSILDTKVQRYSDCKRSNLNYRDQYLITTNTTDHY